MRKTVLQALVVLGLFLTLPWTMVSPPGTETNQPLVSETPFVLPRTHPAKQKPPSRESRRLGRRKKRQHDVSSCSTFELRASWAVGGKQAAR